jgi:LacI family transcriptional regulator
VTGWREAIAAAGQGEQGALLRLGVRDAAAAEIAARALLMSADPPTALFALSGRVAPGLLAAALEAEAVVELLVFGRLPLADLLPLPVAFVDYDASELGRRGAELLLDRLDGNAGPARRVVLPTTLLHR